MRAIGTLILSLLICCLFGFSPARAQIAIGISIDVAPPPLPVYDQPPIPEPGYIWTPGYWAWDDDSGYYWVPGTWVLPPEPALLWTPGYWGWNDGVYSFHEGYWGPEVGFYGGVSYGYGYGGVGYEGGYWRGGAFFYNRSVNNFSNVQITNVYNKTVVVNNRTNVSYNGGTGGTTAHATPQQIAAASQQHVPPTPQQTQHMQMAAKDPALSLNNNHGHPTVAATSHAAQLSGAGVVAAHPGTPVAAIAPQGHNVGGAGGTATGNAPAGQGAKTGPGNALQGNHALPGVQSPGTAGTGAAATGAAGTGAAGTKTGPANAATLPGNHALPGVQQHGGSATGSPTTVGSTNPSADVKTHKATGTGTATGTGSGSPSGAGSTPHINKLPSTAVHTPPPPPPQPHISSPPPPHIQAAKPPPPPARVASPPPPKPAPPPPPKPAPKPAAAAKKCPPGQQHC